LLGAARERTIRFVEPQPLIRLELKAVVGSRPPKKKMSRKERSERARIDAEDSPIVRQLRELYARGMAEIEERRKLDPNAR
jgi:hypothetical protein